MTRTANHSAPKVFTCPTCHRKSNCLLCAKCNRPPRIELFWVRVGDAGDYQSFDDLADLIDYLNELNVGTVWNWIDAGFTTENFYGLDYISLFVGDRDANHDRDLTQDERRQVSKQLRTAYL
jgi:hypothetical protein